MLGVRRSLWREADRRSLFARLAHLAPTDAPHWGRMTAHEMVVHLGDGARMALGTLPVRSSHLRAARWLRLPIAKHTFVYILPFPRNAPTARELLSTQPTDWDNDVATFMRLTEELAARAAGARCLWPSHPFFGRLTRRAWGALGYRHTDHHLRQFGA